MKNCTLNYSSYRNIFPIWALGEYRRHILHALMSTRPDDVKQTGKKLDSQKVYAFFPMFPYVVITKLLYLIEKTFIMAYDSSYFVATLLYCLELAIFLIIVNCK